MLRDKGNMRHGKLHGLSGGPEICEAGGVGGGGGGGCSFEGLVDFIFLNIKMYKTDILFNHTL